MRQSVFVVGTVICLIFASVGLFVTAEILDASAVPETSGATEEVVLSFYSAINEFIATGSPFALRRVVAQDFHDVEPLPGVEEGRRGLETYVERLALYRPKTRIVLENLVASSARWHECVWKVILSRLFSQWDIWGTTKNLVGG